MGMNIIDTSTLMVSHTVSGVSSDSILEEALDGAPGTLQAWGQVTVNGLLRKLESSKGSSRSLSTPKVTLGGHCNFVVIGASKAQPSALPRDLPSLI